MGGSQFFEKPSNTKGTKEAFANFVPFVFEENIPKF